MPRAHHSLHLVSHLQRLIPGYWMPVSEHMFDAHVLIIPWEPESS